MTKDLPCSVWSCELKVNPPTAFFFSSPDNEATGGVGVVVSGIVGDAVECVASVDALDDGVEGMLSSLAASSSLAGAEGLDGTKAATFALNFFFGLCCCVVA